MADQAEDLRAALAEAVEASGITTDEVADQASWDTWEDDGGTSAPAADDAAPSKGEEPAVEEEPETPEAQADLPDVYWGVPLEGIPVEQRQVILEKLQQQDSYIRKLQDRLSKEPEPVTVEAPVAEEVTDEALLQALGFNPEDWETQQLAPKILPLARTVLDLEEKVEQLVTTETTRQVQTQWNTQLDELEATYGKLPVDRVKVLQFAIEEGVPSPFEAYFRLSAPAKREVENAVAEARRSAAKQAESGGVKPRTSTGTSQVISKDTPLKDAVRMAMVEAEKETGLSFKKLFGRKVAE